MLRAVLLTIAMAGPAWLVGMATAVPLYLSNQTELHYQVSVLWPFALLSLLCGAVMAGLALALPDRRASRGLLWAWLLLGLLWLCLQQLPELGLAPLWPWAVLCALVWLGGSWALARATAIWPHLGFLSAAAVLLAAPTAWELLTRAEQPASQWPQAQSSANADLPNVYHLLLDEFQGDLFGHTLTPELREGLAGFTWFRDTVTPFGRTSMALGAIFTGQPYRYDQPQRTYKEAAITGDTSILHQARQAGYATEGWLFPIYTTTPTLLDRWQHHAKAGQFAPGRSREAFVQLWLYAHLPEAISAQLLPEAVFRQHAERTVLDASAPVDSLQSFDRFLLEEARQPATGRYVFVHLLVPHAPNVLDAKCNWDRDGGTTAPLDQVRCAQLLIQRLVQRLDDLNRLDRSLVVVHSDHGSRYQLQEGELVNVEPQGLYSDAWTRARTSSLLLIKPPEAQGGQLETSNRPASLLDIAPTLRSLLTLPAPDGEPADAGLDLFGGDFPTDRIRHYHFYDQKGGSGWTDEMVRYRVVGDSIEREQVFPLTNNPFH